MIFSKAVSFRSAVLGVLAICCAGAAMAQGGSTAPIRIGLPSFLSGTGAVLGEDLVKGFEFYVKEQGNKFDQRPIQVIREDTEGKPSVALAKIRKLIDKDRVDLIFGIINSGEAYAAIDYIKKAKVPLLLNAGADALTQRDAHPYVFRFVFTNSQLVHPLADYVYKKMGKRRAVVFGADYPGGYEHVRAFERVFKELGGEVVKVMWAPMGTTDFAPYLVGLDKVDVMYGFFFGGDAIRLVKQYREFGLSNKIPLVGNNLADELILPALGDGGLNIITAESYTPNIDTPLNRAFVARYRKEYGQAPTQYAEYGYTGARVVFAALAAVKGRIENREAFLAALRKVDVNDTPRGPVKLDKYQQAILNTYIRKVEKVGNEYQNTILETIPNVSQFWTYPVEEYIKTTKYVR